MCVGWWLGLVDRVCGGGVWCGAGFNGLEWICVWVVSLGFVVWSVCV